jgi:hypothetical protein
LKLTLIDWSIVALYFLFNAAIGANHRASLSRVGLEHRHVGSYFDFLADRAQFHLDVEPSELIDFQNYFRKGFTRRCETRLPPDGTRLPDGAVLERRAVTNRDLVLNLDFAELFLDYAGLKTPEFMQGRTFRRNLCRHTPSDWRQSMYYRYWMHMTEHGVPAHYGVRSLARCHLPIMAVWYPAFCSSLPT